jgi:glutamyl-tRNA synthetase
MIRVRFASAPSGSLLLGSARVALANHLFALRGNGQMLLRLDDLVPDRSRPVLADQIRAEQVMQDLRWLGIDWHSTFRQSERMDVYQDVIARLKRDQFIYPCFESEEELKAKQEFRRKRNQPLIYDRAMLSLTEKQRHDAEAGGKRPHWRFKVSGRTMEWKDLVLGPRRATLTTVSDPILVRADGTPSALLASVADDIGHGTTHIIRAEDNAGNTAIQLELFEVLRGPHRPVRFGHLPALGDSGKAPPGGRRVGNLALRSLRADGVEPWAIITCIAGVQPENGGTVEHGDMSLTELVRRFELTDLTTSRFDIAQMLALNRHLLGKLDFAAVSDRLPDGASEAFWLAVRGRLDLLKEARGWWDVVAGTIVPPVIEGARDLLLSAGSLLPPEPWDSAMWITWLSALEQTTGYTGDALLAPLRLALTGEDSGPELADLLPLIGRPRAASRLAIAAA